MQVFVNDQPHEVANQATVSELIEQLEVQNTGSDWECPACGETLEPQFEVCWNCGQEPPT